eukprot:TRINITY_DN3069_c1_g5_i1.p1 TRINITY_DN3069_c1_g5~~TRINITY_DN3069_c1_g5_i1.p1  ORF type:complete len:185 (-),score=32.16 TRINITY_DN3069_c1_g5_i1:159-671(-)
MSEDRISRHFNNKGSSYNVSRPKFGSAGERCARCNGRVYEAEKVLAIGKPWHQKCLKCPECNKRLDSTTLTEHDDEVYCKACYGKKFGPTGFGNIASSHTESAGQTHKPPMNAAPRQVDTDEPSAVNSGTLHHVEADSGVAGTAPKFCPQCGTKNQNPDGKFCSGCGHKF